MHNAEQRELSSDTMDTLRSQKPHKRLTATEGSANKRVSTCFFVHDLDLFVIVQLLVETPVILLLHKFCSKRGYSYELKKVQTPRLTQNGKTNYL